MLKELKNVLEGASNDSPKDFVSQLEKASKAEDVSDEDIAVINVIKYLTLLTESQNDFFTRTLNEMGKLFTNLNESNNKLVDKVESLKTDMAVAENISKNQKRLGESVGILQKTLFESQKFNKEAMLEIKRDIMAVVISNSKESPVPVDIIGNLKLDEAISVKVTSFRKIGKKNKPAVLELTFNKGKKKILTINRNQDGSYSGHKLEDARNS